LAHALKGKINSYFGVDISEQYISIAKEKCMDYPNFQFSELPMDQNHTQLSHYAEKGIRFDTIIILSVIQYFRIRKPC